MDWREMFSFKGRAGRGQLLSIWVTTGIASGILQVIPSIAHEIILMRYGAKAFDSFMTPAAIGYWSLLAISYFLRIVLAWIFVATIVKRQHDRGRSGKWVAYYIGVFVITLALADILIAREPTLSFPGILSLVLLCLVAIAGAIGLGEMLFARGVPVGVEPGNRTGTGA